MITFTREDEETVLVSLENQDKKVISSILNKASQLYERRPNSTTEKDTPHLEAAKSKIASTEGNQVLLKDNELEAFGRAVNEVSARISFLDDVSEEVLDQTSETVGEQYDRYRLNMI